MSGDKRRSLGRRGCLVGLAVMFSAWAIVTGVVGGLVYLVDKVIH